jgi:hypothetical protein
MRETIIGTYLGGGCAKSPNGKHQVVVRRYQGFDKPTITECCNFCHWGAAREESEYVKRFPSPDIVPDETLHR